MTSLNVELGSGIFIWHLQAIGASPGISLEHFEFLTSIFLENYEYMWWEMKQISFKLNSVQ